MISTADILHAKILIVDDLEANVRLLEQLLQRNGYTSVMSTVDSTRVCELHLVHRFDLILLDLLMPGMDGFQVMENLKEIELDSYLPVLVITAQPEHKLRAFAVGARDFISKPFDLAEICARVRNMIEVRLLHLEAVKMNIRLVDEQKISERLLHNVLPHSVAEYMNRRFDDTGENKGDVIVESYAEVALLFADIIEFTKFAEGSGAAVLSSLLNDISADMENLAPVDGMKRNRLMNDAYLGAVELRDEVANRTIRAARKALDLSDALNRFNAHSRYQLKVRIENDRGRRADSGGMQKDTFVL